MSAFHLRRSLLLVAVAAQLGVTACSGGSSGGSTPPLPTFGANDGSEDEALFRPDQVLTYRVQIKKKDIDWIEEHGIDEKWKPTVDVTVTGLPEGTVSLGKVGFRHKGSVGTLTGCWGPPDPAVVSDPDSTEEDVMNSRERIYDDYCARLSYKLKFDKYTDGQTFHGVVKLNLHAMQRDPTKLHELLSYGLFREFGVDAPRAAPAFLTIDILDTSGNVVETRPMGLFIAVEDVDESWPAHHYVGADGGNLWKEVWPNPILPGPGTEEAFTSWLEDQLENAPETPDVSDFVDFTATVANASRTSFAADMTSWLDLDEVLRYMAVDRAIRNWDGVTATYCWNYPDCTVFAPHNLYWYHATGTDGRLHLIPWDLDNTLQGWDPYMHPNNESEAERPVPDWNVKPASCSSVRVWVDSHVVPPGCDHFLNLLAATQWSRYADWANRLADGPLQPGVMQEQARAWAALMEPYLEDDPFVSLDGWRAERDWLINDVLGRAEREFRLEVAEGYVDETD